MKIVQLNEKRQQTEFGKNVCRVNIDSKELEKMPKEMTQLCTMNQWKGEVGKQQCALSQSVSMSLFYLFFDK